MRDTASVRITAIRLERLVLPLDPAFPAAWDPVPRRSFAATVVRVETDEGVIGVGSGDTMDGFEAFEHLFVGQDPLAIARHVRVLETIDFHAGRYWPLEAALWDIVGKVAGLPVATLFGGATDGHPGLRLVRDAAAGPASVPSPRLRLREEGFRALKIRVDPRRLEEGLAAVTATRTAVGDSMAIMVDLNQGWRMAGDTSRALDPVAAREIAARLADDDVLWLEEPLAGTDLRGLAALRASAPGVRIAGGEMTRTLPEMVAAVEADAFDVHQPDVVLTGLSHARTIAELALRATAGSRRTPGRTGSACWPTCTSRPGVGGGPVHRISRTTRPAGPPNVATSCSPSPSGRDRTGSCACRPAPGLGIVLDEAALRRYAA